MNKKREKKNKETKSANINIFYGTFNFMKSILFFDIYILIIFTDLLVNLFFIIFCILIHI